MCFFIQEVELCAIAERYEIVAVISPIALAQGGPRLNTGYLAGRKAQVGSDALGEECVMLRGLSIAREVE